MCEKVVAHVTSSKGHMHKLQSRDLAHDLGKQQVTSFAACETTIDSKMWGTLHIPEYTLAVNQGVFEKSELFRFYVNTRQINVSTIYSISLHIQSCLPVRHGFHFIIYLACFLY